MSEFLLIVIPGTNTTVLSIQNTGLVYMTLVLMAKQKVVWHGLHSMIMNIF